MSIPIPERLKDRPQFRGVALPFVQYIRPDGFPDFKITDTEKWVQCINGRLCGMCGSLLEIPIVFIGGELCVRNLAYHDPPMHAECAEYAFNICPFLVGKKNFALEVPKYEGAVVTIDPNASAERPKKIGMLFARTYEAVEHRGEFYYRPIGLRNILWREFEHA